MSFSTTLSRNPTFVWNSALEVVLHDYALYKSTFTLLYFIAYKEFKDGLFISETKQQVTTAP